MNFAFYTDGGSRGNPGPAAWGFVLYQDGQKIAGQGGYLGITTNNVAEYTACIEALRYIKAQWGGGHLIKCFADSKLMIEQLNGRYKIKAPHLKPLIAEMHTLSKDQSIAYHHIPREKNTEADRLVNITLDQHR